MISPDQLHSSGGNATFLCEAVEGLQSNVTWLRGETELVVSNNSSLSVLTLLNVTAADGGEYTCQVSTEVGTSFAATQLFISPYFTTLPEDTTGANGTTATLTCEAEGYPEPEYQWSRADGTSTEMGSGMGSGMLLNPMQDEMPLGEIGEGSGVLAGMLEFTPALFGDEGNYTCTATSGSISIQSTATLTSMSRQSYKYLCDNSFGGSTVDSLIIAII